MFRIWYTEADKSALRTEFEEILRSASFGNEKIIFDPINTQVPENVVNPTVFITCDAKQKINTLINSTDKEVGCHAIVEKHGTGRFLITDILVYPQKVSGAYIDVDEQEYGEWQNSLSDELFNGIHGQLHSHVNMAVTPSGTDIDHYEKIARMIHDDDGYYIFLIINKRNEIYARVYDFEQNICFEKKEVTVAVVTENGENINNWYTEEIKGKIKDITPKTPNPKTSTTIPATATKKSDYQKWKETQDKWYDDYYNSLLGE